MKRIFRNKKLTYMLAAMTIVLLLLVLMLLTTLSQWASLSAKQQQLDQMIKEISGSGGKLDQSQQLLDYLKSNEYLIAWAIEQDLLPPDAYGWIQK